MHFRHNKDLTVIATTIQFSGIPTQRQQVPLRLLLMAILLH
jgi:hypothetical protein